MIEPILDLKFKNLKEMKKNFNFLQRLKPPVGYENPFGAATLMRLQPAVKEKLVNIACFDYMGAAEYELGSIPRSLDNIFRKKNKKIFHEVIKGTKFILLIPKSEKQEYLEKIKIWCESNDDGHNEYSGLLDIISNKALSESCNDLTGWLDLTDDVLFFRDTKAGEKMANDFLQLLS